MTKTPKERRRPFPSNWETISQAEKEQWTAAEDQRVLREIRAEADAKTIKPGDLKIAKEELAARRKGRFDQIADARHGGTPPTDEDRAAILDTLWREDEVERFTERKAQKAQGGGP